MSGNEFAWLDKLSKRKGKSIDHNGLEENREETREKNLEENREETREKNREENR